VRDGITVVDQGFQSIRVAARGGGGGIDNSGGLVFHLNPQLRSFRPPEAGRDLIE
jgi:hypothetical protein